MASQSALVVAPSPNTPFPLFSDRTASGNITSTQTVSISTIGCSTVTAQVSGTWTGTVVFEMYGPNGTLVGNIPAFNVTTGTQLPTVFSIPYTTSNVVVTIPCAGFVSLNVIGSSVSSGTAVINIEASQGRNAFTVLAQGTPTNLIGSVALVEGQKATYSASVFNQTLPTITDNTSYFFAIQGSATKTVKIKRIGFSGTKTTTGQATFGLFLVSLLSGGTPVSVTPASHDTTSPSATAVVTSYQTGSTPGAILTGQLRYWDVFLPATGTGTPTQIDEQFGLGPMQSIVLRGTGQYLTFACFGGPAGANINPYITWTEE